MHGGGARFFGPLGSAHYLKRFYRLAAYYSDLRGAFELDIFELRDAEAATMEIERENQEG